MINRNYLFNISANKTTRTYLLFQTEIEQNWHVLANNMNTTADEVTVAHLKAARGRFVLINVCICTNTHHAAFSDVLGPELFRMTS